MNIEYIFSYSARLSSAIRIGEGNSGIRDIYQVAEGSVWGPRLSGRLLPLGGEFQLSDKEGLTRVDVRLVIETDDGVPIYVQYDGIFDFTRELKRRMHSKGQLAFGEAYWVTKPVLETGSDKYSWLNRAVFIAEGRARALDEVEYRVYQCLPG